MPIYLHQQNKYTYSHWAHLKFNKINQISGHNDTPKKP